MLGVSNTQALVFVNGKITSAKEARVSVFDRGFLFGDGVYETGKSVNRCPLFLEEHWARLRHSADRLAIPTPWSDGELSRGLFDTARLFGKPDVYFRTIITRGVIDRVGLDVLDCHEPTLIHIIHDLPAGLAKYREAGVRLATASIVRNPKNAQDPNIKTSNYLNSLLALQNAKSRGAEDALMCTIEGHVAEGTTFSVFGVTDNSTVITPSLDVGILDSITRRHILALAKKKFKVEEGFFDLSTFQDCLEVFIASSLREIVPVKEWDARQYSIHGEVSSFLLQRLMAEVQEYVQNHSKF